METFLLIAIVVFSVTVVSSLIILLAIIRFRSRVKQESAELECLHDKSEKRFSKIFAKEELMKKSVKLNFDEPQDDKESPLPLLSACEIKINYDMGDISHVAGENWESKLWSLQHKSNSFKACIGKRYDVNEDLQERHGLSPTSDIYKLTISKDGKLYATMVIVYSTDVIFLVPYEVEKFPKYTIRRAAKNADGIVTISHNLKGKGLTPFYLERSLDYSIVLNF